MQSMILIKYEEKSNSMMVYKSREKSPPLSLSQK